MLGFMCMYDVIKFHNSNFINQNCYSVTEFSSLILKFHVKGSIILQCFADSLYYIILFFLKKRKKLLEMFLSQWNLVFILEFLTMHIHKLM